MLGSFSETSGREKNKLKLEKGVKVEYLREACREEDERWVGAIIEDVEKDEDGVWIEVKTNDGKIHEVALEDNVIRPWYRRFPVTQTFRQVKTRYTFKEKLGVGTTSTVRLALRKSDGKEFAIKQIKTKRLEPDELEQIEKEIELLNTMRHPHVVEMEEYIVTENFIFIVLEHLAGGHLFDQIVQKGQFSEQEAAIITKQIFSAVSYMHELGFCHRDLKPLNLMLVSDDTLDLKVIDFGYVGEMNTGLATILGSPSFLAPEIVLENPYDTKVDVWAVGVILYMMLTGSPPFGRKNSVPDTFKMIVENEVTFPENIELSNKVKALLLSLLSKDPASRPRSCEVTDHPWFSSASPKHLSHIHTKSIRNLNNYWKLRRGVHSVIAAIRLAKLTGFELYTGDEEGRPIMVIE